MTIKVLIPMASGCEELEAVTLINIFRRAGFEVVTAGLEVENSLVKCARGTAVLPDTTLDQAITGDYDLVVLPGGQPGTDNLMRDERIIKLIQEMQSQDRHVAAICAAPMVLAKAGVLQGKSATSYPGCLDKMGLPGVNYLEDAVVVDGKVITSRGPGTAMDFALQLVEIMAGAELRKRVEGGLQRP
ncbi:MAG: DJ-1/PfpI family protein [Desulfobulbaceae bacterium]|nr:DJ-1/PfpI family protein [Desulfobulbaceae bacterium]